MYHVYNQTCPLVYIYNYLHAYLTMPCRTIPYHSISFCYLLIKLYTLQYIALPYIYMHIHIHTHTHIHIHTCCMSLHATPHILDCRCLHQLSLAV